MPDPRATLLVIGLSCGLSTAACRRAPPPPTQARAQVQAGSADAFPLSVQDDARRNVVVPAPPRRIVCLLPSFTETVFALGAGDQIIAVDDYSDYPPSVGTLPKLGGLYDTQVERALSLKPDLILAPVHSSALSALASGGVPVWAGEPRTFEDVFRVIAITGQLIGRSTEASALVLRLRRDIENVEASVQALPKVSVYYEIDPAPYTVGPRSFIGVLLTKAGGDNIIPTTLGDFPKINLELILSRDPSVILGVSEAELKRRPGFASLGAVKNHRVHVFPPAEAHLLGRPGPRLAEGLRLLVGQLHPTP